MFLSPLKIIVLCTTRFLYFTHSTKPALTRGGRGGGNGKPFKGKRSTFAKPTFILNIYFHDVSLKNCSILYAKQNKSGLENNDSSLKQGRKMSSFCLKQAKGLKASAVLLFPDFP